MSVLLFYFLSWSSYDVHYQLSYILQEIKCWGVLMWGVSNETHAHIYFCFPIEAKPQLLISFLEERNPQRICRLRCRIGCKKIRCWGGSVYREGKIFGVTINFIFLASSQSFHWKDLYFKILYFPQQNIISSCLDEESFP